MHKSELPAGTVIRIGAEHNFHLAVKASPDKWRYVVSGEFVSYDDLHKAWWELHTPEPKPAEFKTDGEFDYHRRQWDKIKSNRGQEGMSVIISSLSGDTNTLSIPNDMARDLLARMSEADI